MAPAVSALAESWSSVYANSAILRTTVSFAHIAGLVAGGGCAVASDRATLLVRRATPSARADQARALGTVHRVVLGGLAAVVLSGILLALADFQAYWAAPIFWLKMALVVALLVNGWVLARAGARVGRGDTTAWNTLYATSIFSLLLWFATTLAGAALPNAL